MARPRLHVRNSQDSTDSRVFCDGCPCQASSGSYGVTVRESRVARNGEGIVERQVTPEQSHTETCKVQWSLIRFTSARTRAALELKRHTVPYSFGECSLLPIVQPIVHRTTLLTRSPRVGLHRRGRDACSSENVYSHPTTCLSPFSNDSLTSTVELHHAGGERGHGVRQ